MSLQDELSAFYQRSGFGEVVGRRPRMVAVYTGCMLVPLPNIETRRRYLEYHDLHHLITGYSVGRIGEGEVSAWELGAGSVFVSPTLGMMNLIALSTGLVLEPSRMWVAFRRGCNSRLLYAADVRAAVDAGRWASVASLRQDCVESKVSRLPIAVRAAEFAGYTLLALVVHAAIALPALVARVFTDTCSVTAFSRQLSRFVAQTCIDHQPSTLLHPPCDTDRASPMTKMARPEDAPRAFQAAWNAHDMDALGALFHQDATFVNRFGHYVRGVDEIVALHTPIHETIYRDSTLDNELIDATRIADEATVVHFWSRLAAGVAHPAGPHTIDTLILAVVTRQNEIWRIQALENVTFTNPRTGQAILRG